MGPEPGRTAAARGQLLMRRTQRAIDVQQAIRQTLEEMRLVPGNPEMVQLDLRLCPCQRACALERRRLTILLRDLDGLLTGTRHECREHHTHRPLRGNRNA